MHEEHGAQEHRDVRRRRQARDEAQGDARPADHVCGHDVPGRQGAHLAQAFAGDLLEGLHVDQEVDATDGQGDADEDAQHRHGVDGGDQLGQLGQGDPRFAIGGQAGALGQRLVEFVLGFSLLLGGEGDQEGGQGEESDDDTQDQQRIGPGQALVAEEESSAHRARVAARADDAGHRAQGLLVDEGHHGEGRTLGHLHEEAEHNHDADGHRQDGHAREDQQRHALDRQGDEQPANAAFQAPGGAKLVADDAAGGAGEDVHQAEETSDQAGGRQAQPEVVLKVERGDVVDGQLDAKAGGVDDEQGPDPLVLAGHQEGALDLLGRAILAALAQLLEVAVGQVGGQEEVGDAGQEADQAGDHHGQAPAGRSGVAQADEAGEDERHDHLGDAAAQVAPTRRGGVGGADTVGREHDRGVVLGDDERSADGANGQPEQQEGLVAVAQADAHHRQ